MKIATLVADSRWEILFKAVEQPLGTDRRE
jgi:hypothetical protein